LRAGRTLDAVREAGPAAPRVQVGREPLGSATAQNVAVPHAEPLELGAICGVEPAELATGVLRLDERRLELAERREQRVAEAAEASRAAETVELRLGDCPPSYEDPLRVGEHAPALAVARRDRCEEVVEGPDPAGKKPPG